MGALKNTASVMERAKFVDCSANVGIAPILKKGSWRRKKRKRRHKKYQNANAQTGPIVCETIVSAKRVEKSAEFSVNVKTVLIINRVKYNELN